MLRHSMKEEELADESEDNTLDCMVEADEDDEKDRIIWQCYACPRPQECNKGNWKKVIKYSYKSKASVLTSS